MSTRRVAILLAGAFLLPAVGAGCASVAERAAFNEIDRLAGELGYADKPSKLPELDKKAGLREYLAYAALNNPGLEAAFNRWKAALERVPQVRSLPDPRFTYRYFIEEVETRVGPQRHAVGIAQTFPWFGKLALRSGVALEAANAARQRYEAEKQKLFYRVKNAYHEYYYLGRAIGIVRENRALVRHFERVVRARYRAAAAKHQDVIRAQIELGKLDDHLLALTELRRPVAARVNAALNRPVDTELPWPAQPPYEEIDATDEQILSRLREASPELKALGHEIAKQRRSLELAGKNYFPDVTVGVDYIDTGGAKTAMKPSDSGKDPVIAKLSINVPIWLQKYRAAEREARMRLRAAMKAKMERENTLSSQAKMVLYQFRDAGRKVGLYRDTLVPKARQAIRANETAFRAGKASFLDLIDAQRVLLEFQLSYERALTDRAQRLAELEALIGGALPRAAKRPAEEPEAPTNPKGGER